MNIVKSGSLAITMALLLPASAAFAHVESPTPSVEPTLSPAAQELADAFPGEVGGVALAGRIDVTELSDPDAIEPDALPLLTDLAADLGIGLGEMRMATAMTFDGFFTEEPTGVWIIAFAAPGMAPDAGIELMRELWILEAEEETLIFSETQIAGRDVTRIESAEDPEVALSIYGGDDIVWMVAGADPALLEETFSKLR